MGGGWKRKKDNGHPEKDKDRKKCRGKILLSDVKEEIIEVEWLPLK